MPPYIVIPGMVRWVTSKAILLELFNGRKIWIPRSVCQNGEWIEPDDQNPAVTERWFFDGSGL